MARRPSWTSELPRPSRASSCCRSPKFLQPAPRLRSVARRVRTIRMRPQPLICVNDVEASSRWYQRRLGCRSDHGGPNYERLVAGDRLVMQLHRWDLGHHHGPIGDQAAGHAGNGVLLWFEVDDIDAAIARAQTMGV